jgi:hypothetical protein
MLSWGRRLLVCVLFAEAAVALPRSADQERINSQQMKAAPSRVEVSRAITAAAGYLERACGPDGRFIYQVDIRSGKETPDYSIVRHGGTVYSLAMLNGDQRDVNVAETMLRAAEYLHQYIGPGVRPGQLAVWSATLTTQRSDAVLGATGLGLVALAAAHEVEPKSVPIEQLQALGRFLLFLQRDDGSFVSKYRVESGPVVGWESLYYPGEAALGLIALYEADHSRQWLDGGKGTLVSG